MNRSAGLASPGLPAAGSNPERRRPHDVSACGLTARWKLTEKLSVARGDKHMTNPFLSLIVAAVAASLGMAPSVAAPGASQVAAGPAEAIGAAAMAGRKGVAGQWTIKVRTVGRASGGRLHLNSSDNYRDPSNLSVSIDKWAARWVLERNGAKRDADLIGRTVIVTGFARKVPIVFTEDGRRTGKFYFQTHVDVTDQSKVRFVD